MNILLVGANGKMGKTILKLSGELDSKIIAGIDNFQNKIDDKNSSKNDKEKTKNYRLKTINNSRIKIFNKFEFLTPFLLKNIDVVLDFSSPEILNEELDFCKNNKLPLVICTTNFTKNQFKEIKQSSKFIPIFLASNTSLLVALLKEIISKYHKLFACCDTTILETHHKSKKDSPSGTAKEFIEILNKFKIKHHCFSIRSGDVTGVHELIFLTNNEELIIRHTAKDRKLFAENTIKICKYIYLESNPGFYTMKNFLRHCKY